MMNRLILYAFILVIKPVTATETESDTLTFNENTSVMLEELDGARGQGGVFDISNNADLNAVLTDNSAANSVTGFNVIDQNSFNDAQGVFSIIQNTGNNVIIQDSTIITITIAPE